MMKYINFIVICLFFCLQLMAMKRTGDEDIEGMSRENLISDDGMPLDLILNGPLFTSFNKLDEFFSSSNNNNDIHQLDDYFHYIYMHEKYFHDDIVIAIILGKLDPSKPSYGFIEGLYDSLHGNFSSSNLDNNVNMLMARYHKLKNAIIEDNDINQKKNEDNQKEINRNIDNVNHQFRRFVDSIDPSLRSKINFSISSSSITIMHNYFGLPPLPEYLLEAIGRLKLKYIKINWDHSGEPFPLGQFIDYLVYPQMLKEADFSKTDLKYLPDNISKLTSLIELNLADNDMGDLPSSITNLTKLKNLNISHNAFKHIPDAIYNIGLFTLDLSYNYINYLNDSIGKLSLLKQLNLSNNNLVDIHPKIGALTKLVNLDLSHNHLYSLPKDIRNLTTNMITFSLTHNHIVDHSDDDINKYGQRELNDIFGDRIVISFTPSIEDIISKEELYNRFDRENLRINRDKLKNTKAKAMPDSNMTPYEFISYWSQLLYSLNFDDDSHEDYLSYDLLIGDFKDDNLLPTNKENITQKLLPRLNGFLKTLWGFELDDKEIAGWQIGKHSHNDMKRALAYIVKSMVEMDDKVFRATLFYQLVNGLLYCPTGQKEGIERVASALTNGELSELDDITTSIAQWIAMKKEEIFASTITPGGRAQNVYVLTKYRDRLKEELGLKTVFSNFVIDEPFFDPYGGDGNALEKFYKHFTPDNLASWLSLDTENDKDYNLADELFELQKQYFLLNNDEEKKANKERQQKIKHQQKTTGSLFKIKDIVNLLFKEGLLDNKLIDDFGYDEDQHDLGLSAQLKKLQEEDILVDNSSQKNKLISHILNLQEVLAKSEDKINAYRSYLLEYKLLDYDWRNYFTSDPMLIGGRPSLTKEGALRILYKLDYISGSLAGKFESHTTYNMFANSVNDN